MYIHIYISVHVCKWILNENNLHSYLCQNREFVYSHLVNEQHKTKKLSYINHQSNNFRGVSEWVRREAMAAPIF